MLIKKAEWFKHANLTASSLIVSVQHRDDVIVSTRVYDLLSGQFYVPKLGKTAGYTPRICVQISHQEGYSCKDILEKN